MDIDKSQKTTKKQVLIIEDNAKISNGLSRILKAHGLEPIVALTHAETRAILESYLNTCSLVLMDACLDGDDPDTIGYILEIKKLRPDLPIVAMSASEEYRAIQVQAGATHQSQKESSPTLALKILREI